MKEREMRAAQLRADLDAPDGLARVERLDVRWVHHDLRERLGMWRGRLL